MSSTWEKKGESAVNSSIMKHDIHVHTTLSSCCSDEHAIPSRMIKRASEQGLEVIGFADHLWDNEAYEPSGWYAPQNYQHLCAIREQIPEDTHGVNVLVGCETEYCGHGRVGISKAVAEKLDFVLIPFSHFHMKGFVVEQEEADSLTAVANLLVERFQEVLELDMATGVAHPFFTLGYTEHDTILGSISDGAFEDCFGRAAERGVSIEIHPGFFPRYLGWEQEDYHEEPFLRMLTIAKDSGCKFHLGSDAHILEGIGSTNWLIECVKPLGITQQDMLQF